METRQYSKLNPDPRDTERFAVISITCEGHDAEAPIMLMPDSYQALVSSLRYAIKCLEDEIDHQRGLPGGMSIRKPRIEQLELDRDRIIDVLCTFDI